MICSPFQEEKGHFVVPGVAAGGVGDGVTEGAMTFPLIQMELY